jgi:hypothetical protein
VEVFTGRGYSIPFRISTGEFLGYSSRPAPIPCGLTPSPRKDPTDEQIFVQGTSIFFVFRTSLAGYNFTSYGDFNLQYVDSLKKGKVPLKRVPILCPVESLAACICTREGYKGIADRCSGRALAKCIDLNVRMVQSWA